MSDDRGGGMGIAELAERAGVTSRTIRYYVAEGLLPSPGGRGQRRAYGQEHLERLETIRQLKEQYLPLHEIRRRLAGPSTTPASPGPPLSRTEDSPGIGVRAPQVTRTSSSVALGAVASQTPIGFGGAPGVGRIEIFDPTETIWRRHTLAPGVELHCRETDDPGLAEAIQRLLREAAAILDGRAGQGARKGR